MKTEEFIAYIEKNKTHIKDTLQINDMQNDIDKIKKDLEMFEWFRNMFQPNTQNDVELKQLKDENQRLKDRFDSANTNIDKLKKDLQRIQEQNQLLSTRLQNLPLNTLQELYNSLNDETKIGIKNSLCCDNELELFTSGVLNIEAIWEYAKYMLIEDKSDFEALRDIFYILFESYKKVQSVEYQAITIGEEFDSYLHIRDNKSEPSGTIQEVLLKGFCNGDEVIKKSVVRVIS